MNDFDKYLKNKTAQDPTEIPESVKRRLEKTLDNLPESNNTAKNIRVFPRLAATAACFILVTLFLLPNLSPTYAQAVGQIPLLGDIVRVVTVRNYTYADSHRQMEINVPKVESDNKSADYINKDVGELTTTLVNRFYKELEVPENNGYGSILVDYETITNTENWFTLKVFVCETAGSSNTYYKFYHINKKTGSITELGDLFSTNEFSDVLVAEIKKQMQEQMASDENVSYWISNSGIGDDFAAVDADHNFYWNKNGELVIVFDKYEVAPGSMGTPEFVIAKEVFEGILKAEYKDAVKE